MKPALDNLTLEVSLKPFYGLDAAGTRAVCERAIEQWRPLVRPAGRISVLFWSADGSEILDYAGDLDGEMEWARFIGNANPHLHPEIPADPEGKSLHARSYLYREDAEKITYRRFSEIARIWREAISGAGKQAEIGVAFDPGGEFSPSSFKYERHREICLANTMGAASFACCYGVLKGDACAYAGFPDGIPDGTGLGTFLGRQFQIFAGDLGFDFIWFSNGFGFGMETWMTAGPLFDGERFAPEKAPETRDRILTFWRDFRSECPRLRIRTRGTNLGTGTDLASDATPLRELYAGGFNFAPPPNSPWAALNGDFGLEIAGYMSRIAELPPGEKFTFRFYLHDPWWLNSPWIDRYERQPHDIYLPLAVSRIRADATTESAGHLNLLTLDDSLGRMPDCVPLEAAPHLLRAWGELPDSAGPLVWLYPFDGLHDAVFGENPKPERLFHNDWFMREAINGGLPVNSVIGSRAFASPACRDAIAGRIIVAPSPLEEEAESPLLDFAASGGDLILYGPLIDAPRLRQLLGLKISAPISGEVEIFDRLAPLDCCGEMSRAACDIRPLMSAGALSEEARPGTELAASAEQQGKSRALAVFRETPGGGRIFWLRGPLALTLAKGDHLPKPDAAAFPFGEFNRKALAKFGWKIGFSAKNRGQRTPVVAIHRHDNAWFYSGSTPDTTVGVSLGSPFGAPLLLGMETWLSAGMSSYRQQRGWRNECRVFVEQGDGWIQHTEELPGQIGVSRRMWVRGLRDATLKFFPPSAAGEVTFWINPSWPFISGEKAPLITRETPHGRFVENAAPISGTALISW